MNMKNRIELIHLLEEELYETASAYNEAKENNRHLWAGSNIEMFNCKEAIKRRITTLRAELLELSKSL